MDKFHALLVWSCSLRLSNAILSTLRFVLTRTLPFILHYCRAKEAEFKKTIDDMGMQLTKFKIEANKREMDIVAAAQAREEKLRREMDDLRAMLQSQNDPQSYQPKPAP